MKWQTANSKLITALWRLQIARCALVARSRIVKMEKKDEEETIKCLPGSSTFKVRILIYLEALVRVVANFKLAI